MEKARTPPTARRGGRVVTLIGAVWSPLARHHGRRPQAGSSRPTRDSGERVVVAPAMVPAVIAPAVVTAVVAPMIAVVSIVPVMAMVAPIVVAMSVPGSGLRFRVGLAQGRRDLRHLRRQRRIGKIQIVRHRRRSLPPRRKPRPGR
jgi:hypothetical protein